MQEISSSFAHSFSASRSLSLCLRGALEQKRNSICLQNNTSELAALSNCFSIEAQKPSAQIGICEQQEIGSSEELANCANAAIGQSSKQSNCPATAIAASLSLGVCAGANVAGSLNLSNCPQVSWLAVKLLQSCAKTNLSGSLRLSNCHLIRWSRSVPVPWQWYPIPVPPPVFERYCQLLPPAWRLPLRFWREVKDYDPRVLPLPFHCWDYYEIEKPVITGGSFIVQHEIHCSVEGIELEILSASIATDVNAYCWTGEISIAPSVFHSILEEIKQSPSQPLIHLELDGIAWEFLWENTRVHCEFNNNNFVVSGRSISAQLGADYAQTCGGIVAVDLQARQIAESVLEFSEFEIHSWQAQDWLIPAGIYDLSSKTPLGVISELAQVAGGFVLSSKTGKKLSVLPLYQHPKEQDWQVAYEYGAGVLFSLDTELSTAATYNSVRICGNFIGGFVYLAAEDGAAEASIIENPLYSAIEVIRAKGEQVLADSGNKTLYTVEMLYAPHRDVALPELCDIVRVLAPSEEFVARVVGIKISANSCTEIRQSLSLMRNA